MTTDQRLARRLTTPDAVVVGLGAMLGAGVFAAVGPAARAAGAWLLVSLALAAGVAYANATSSAQLAARYPEAGGTHVYARERLGERWGFLAGWAFVVGKTASLSAMALTFGAYAAPGLERPLAMAAVVGATAVNLRGIQRTARVTRVLVVVVLATLAGVVAAGLTGPRAPLAWSAGPPGGMPGVLEAAGILFFAFAGYARIATLGEEVREPERTIPRAIPLALGIVVVTYAVVLGTAVLTVGPTTLATAPAPLVAVVTAGSLPEIGPVVRVGAAAASASVLLSLLAGVSRTTLSMARRRELPDALAAIHPVRQVPHRAELVVGAVVVVLVLVTDLRGAIGASSFGVLTYYGLANASAWTQPPGERRWPRWLPAAGVVGCVVLALSLPRASVVGGMALLGSGLVVDAVRRRARTTPPTG